MRIHVPVGRGTADIVARAVPDARNLPDRRGARRTAMGRVHMGARGDRLDPLFDGAARA